MIRNLHNFCNVIVSMLVELTGNSFLYFIFQLLIKMTRSFSESIIPVINIQMRDSLQIDINMSTSSHEFIFYNLI